MIRVTERMMTIPQTPLPEVKDLLQAFWAPMFTGRQWVDDRFTYTVRIYRRGSLALAAAIDAVQRASLGAAVIVWIPDYFCNEALDPLRYRRVTIKFYPIQEDLTPDYSALQGRYTHGPETQVLLIVHYFGFPNAIQAAKAFCDQLGMMLLEDAAHVLLPSASMIRGHIQVFSPRKSLPVPSGGILVISRELELHLDNISRACWSIDSLCWLYRRLAQSILFQLHIPWHCLWTVYRRSRSVNEISELRHNSQEQCDSFALRLLTVMEQRLDEVIERRRVNYQRLLDWTSELVWAHPLFSSLPNGVCPYALPLWVESGAEKMVTRLRRVGIPASRWPNLPPEVLGNVRHHKVANMIHEHVLLLPVHQTLSLSQIDMMGQRLRTLL